MLSSATHEGHILYRYLRNKLTPSFSESWGMFKPIPQPPGRYSQSGVAVEVTSVNWLHRRGSNDERHKFVVSSYLWHGVL